MPITLETAQLVGVVLSFVGGFVGFGWAFARWLIARIDAEDSRLNARIDEVRDNAVMRDTYNHDVNRLHSELDGVKAEMHSVRDQIISQSQQTNSRLDSIILKLAANGNGNRES